MFLSKRRIAAILDKRIEEVQSQYADLAPEYEALCQSTQYSGSYFEHVEDTMDLLSTRLTELEAVRRALLGDATIPHAAARKA